MSPNRAGSLGSSSRIVDVDEEDIYDGIPLDRVFSKVREREECRDYMMGRGVDSDGLIEGGRANNIMFRSNEKSRLSLGDLRDMRREYDIQDWVSLHAPFGAERASWNLPGWTCMYQLMFKDGLRLPLPRLLVEACTYHGIPPSQLMPNAWRILMALQVLGELNEMNVTLADVLDAYTFQGNPIDKGRYFFVTKLTGTHLIEGLKDPGTKWKPKYFFIPREALGLPDGCEMPLVWSSASECVGVG